jgi:Zn-dependent protease
MVLTVLVVGCAWALGGPRAARAAGLAGALATLTHVWAVAQLKPALVRPFERLWVRWAMGMGGRLAGLAAVAVAILAAPDRFPPLPTAAGFVGVLLPLLFSEMRLVAGAMRTER